MLLVIATLVMPLACIPILLRHDGKTRLLAVSILVLVHQQGAAGAEERVNAKEEGARVGCAFGPRRELIYRRGTSHLKKDAI